MSQKINTEINLVTEVIKNKPTDTTQVISNKVTNKFEEINKFSNLYEDFDFDNIIFNKEDNLLNVSIYNKKTKSEDTFKMCSLIYPSKWFRNEITKEVKFEVTFFINKKFDRVILNGDIRKNDLMDTLRKFGFGLKDNKGDISSFFVTYFFNALQYLKDTVEPAKLVSQFGMQDNGGFALGNTFIDKEGNISECDTTSELSFLVSEFRPKGTKENFIKHLNDFFKLKGVAKHKFYALCLMSTPILSILDKKGSVINFYSQESGLNKSSTETIAQLFYRNRSQLDNGFTPLSVLKEASLVNGLPVIIEEFSDLMRRKPEDVLQLIHKITGGTDNKRLNKSAQQVETKSFRVNLGGSSNLTLYSIIPAESVAELVRVSEISLLKSECKEEDMEAIYLMHERMKEDCGYGYIYVKKLIEQRLALRNNFNLEFKNISKNIFQDPRFRYVANTFACAMTFAHLLKDMGIKIDMKEIEDVLQVIINETIGNFNDSLITKDKIINQLLSVLKINHAVQETGKAMIMVKNHLQYEGLLLNGKELIIPKAIFDNKVALSSDKRVKTLFGLTNKEIATIVNEKDEILTIQQKTYDGKRTQCVVIKLPLDFTTAIFEIVKDEIDEDNPFQESKIKQLKK